MKTPNMVLFNRTKTTGFELTAQGLAHQLILKNSFESKVIQRI